MKHLRISKTHQATFLASLDYMKSTESLSFALSLRFSLSPVMVQLRRCEFISVADRVDWRASLIPCHSSTLMGMSLFSGLSFSLSFPPDRHLLSSITHSGNFMSVDRKNTYLQIQHPILTPMLQLSAAENLQTERTQGKCYSIDFLKA